ncbi:MAG TPA: serine/threonine-protein kinase [Noviherbaspirillum sp.]|uniref:serine/threonine protein kinase n=1 Tax=Noviherbaspirillum sp. TaxID=1926288 RepID=UPI002B494E79|nr:serine/threonine-protein kinase [Noviherbaspirillum sp.]HJV86279.1 serine/threonine-protein kinase [Noviherbaspirillum sp.]
MNQNVIQSNTQNTSQLSENCLAVGTRLAEFEIRSVIGEGGFGIVYLAFDHSLQRTVAIKEYMPALLAGRGKDDSVTIRAKQNQHTFEKGLKSFINEARLLAQFDHPALIKVYRFWEQNNTGYMAMRYYEGRTLKTILSENPAVITEAWLKSILAPVLEALEALYKVNILHRDISPDNIMVQNNGQAVLLDFGSARQIISDITQSLTVILKPGYAPVEQYADERFSDDAAMMQGPWTDIYSLSAVIYLLITKSPPPVSVGRMIKDPIATLETGDYPGFSKPFLAAIDKGLHVQPQERPQSIDEFRRLLGLATGARSQSQPSSQALPEKLPPHSATILARAEATNSAGPITSSGKSVPATPAPKAKWPWIAAALVLALAVTGGLLVRGKPKAGETIASAGAGASADTETSEWDKLKDNKDATPAAIRAYLKRYPNGTFAQVAETRLAMVQEQELIKRIENTGETTSAQAKDKQPEGAPGDVKLNIAPWGTVSVDGVEKGVSPPLKHFSLPEGKHRIKIENPAFKAHVIDVEIHPKKRLTIEHHFSANS